MAEKTTDVEFCHDMRISMPKEWQEPEQYYTYGGIIYDAQPNGPARQQRWPEWLRQVLGWVAAVLVFGLLGFSVCRWRTRP